MPFSRKTSGQKLHCRLQMLLISIFTFENRFFMGPNPISALGKGEVPFYYARYDFTCLAEHSNDFLHLTSSRAGGGCSAR